MDKTHRQALLEEASELVNGDRNVDYGNPNDDFQKTADYWNIYIRSILMRDCHENGLVPPKGEDLVHFGDIMDTVSRLIQPKDVAIMMMQLKMSRLSWSPWKRDHWVDIAGYAACGWDCVESE